MCCSWIVLLCSLFAPVLTSQPREVLPPQDARAPTTTPAGQPALVVDRTHVDLGRIREGGTYDLTFQLSNTGSAALVLHKVVSSCSCAVIKPTRNQLEPAESVMLNVSFDSTRLSGPQLKTITLHTNDPQQPQVVLSVACDVETPFTLLPSERVSFTNLRPGEALNDPITIVAGKPGVFFDQFKVVVDPQLEFTTEAVDVDGLSGMRVHFRLKADAPIGLFSASATVSFRIGAEPYSVTIPIAGRVISDIAVLPRMLVTIDPVRAGQPIPYGRITLRSIDQSKRFKILHVAVGDNLEYEIHHDEDRAGLVYHVDLRVAPQASPGVFSHMVTLFTDSRSESVITVPVYVQVAGSVQCQPPAAFLDRASDGTGHLSQIIELSCADCATLGIQRVESSNIYILASVRDAPDLGAGQLVVMLSPDMPAGHHEALVTLYTDVPSAKVVTLPVYAEVSEPVTPELQPTGQSKPAEGHEDGQ